MLKAIRYYIEQSWLLIVSAFFFGLLIALTNTAWSGKIENNKTEKLNWLMKSLITDAEKFEIVLKDAAIKLNSGKMAKTDVYQAFNAAGANAGFCFRAEGTGFADKIELVIAVDSTFAKIAGYNVLTSSETPGFGDKIGQSFYNDQYKGAPVGLLSLSKQGDDKKIDDEIIAISGATVSSTAVVNIFNNYLEQIKSQVLQKGLIK
jgi:electron transport complex protein RnfG